MDGLTFLASVIGSLAWPVTILAVAWLFRTQFASAIGRIRSVEGGGAKVVLEETKVALLAGIASGVTGATGPIGPASASPDVEGPTGPTGPRAPRSDLGVNGVKWVEPFHGSIADAYIAQIRDADTTEALMHSVSGFVAARSRPDLRGLSTDRINLETELYRAILELQSMRVLHPQFSSRRELPRILGRISLFWAQPGLTSDAEVSDLTTAIRSELRAAT
ncbi:MAG TPA: hypothetical protein VF763_02280 [Candidatus Limnocylindrales bacterium]